MMNKKHTVGGMPVGKDSTQISFTALKSRKLDYEEAARREHLRSTGSWIFQAVEEKLQRDCPDLYKRG